MSETTAERAHRLRINMAMYGWNATELAEWEGLTRERIRQIVGFEFASREVARSSARRALRSHWARYLKSQRPRAWKWPPVEICRALREFHEREGRTPVASEMGAGPPGYGRRRRVEGLPPYYTLIRWKGSLSAAYEACGLPSESRGSGDRVNPKHHDVELAARANPGEWQLLQVYKGAGAYTAASARRISRRWQGFEFRVEGGNSLYVRFVAEQEDKE